jgi:Methylamine utilisation protein MauE
VIWAALVRLTIATLLGSAAIAKARSPNTFAQALLSHHVVPDRTVPGVAVGVIVSEAAISALLVAGVAVPQALVAAALLLLAFAGGAARSLARNQAVDCGCLGNVARIRLDWWTVGTNVLLAIAAIASATQPVASAPLPTDHGGPPGTALIAWLGALLLVVVYWLLAYARSVVALMNESMRSEAT